MRRLAVLGFLLSACLMQNNWIAAQEPTIASDAKATQSLQVGATVPDVELTGLDGKAVRLSSLYREKPLVLDLEKASGFQHHALPIPAIYIVNQAGRVVFAHSNPDYRERLDPAKLLVALEKPRVDRSDDSEKVPAESQANPEKLTILWTSGDPEVAHRMVLMYGKAAKSNQWFDEVRLIIWGPSARLVAADKDIQAKLNEMKQNGIVIEACVVCADSYGVTERLRELGIEVKPMGKPLSSIIREKSSHLITF